LPRALRTNSIFIGQTNILFGVGVNPYQRALLRRTSVFDLLALSVSTQPRSTYQTSPNQTQIGKRRIKTVLHQLFNSPVRALGPLNRTSYQNDHIHGNSPLASV
jgi:hypothetical protein